MSKYEYTILDNKCNAYKKEFISDSEAVSYIRKYWRDYIVSITSNDQIWLYRPNKLLLATVNTSTGYVEVK